METKSNRIAACFAALKQQGRPGLVTFVTAGDPDRVTSQAIINDLPQSGADIIELGMPFSDPMADGPAIQLSSQRALKAKADMNQTLDMVRSFRINDTKTPLILMGYFNPIYAYGTGRFVKNAKESGVDGLIVVDLPPEEDHELLEPAHDAGLDIIRLITPTTDETRLETILKGAGGFLYYVAVAGVTGAASASSDLLKPRLDHIRKKTDLPIAIGFGIKSPGDARDMGRIADAVVVGSALVHTVGEIAKGSANQSDLSAQVRALRAALPAKAA